MGMLEEERSWPGNTSLPLDPEFGCYASDDFTWRTWIHRFTHKAGCSFWAGIFQPAYWHHNSWCEFSRPQAAFEYMHTHSCTLTNFALQCHYGDFYSVFSNLYLCLYLAVIFNMIQNTFIWGSIEDVYLCLWYYIGVFSYQHLVQCWVNSTTCVPPTKCWVSIKSTSTHFRSDWFHILLK